MVNEYEKLLATSIYERIREVVRGKLTVWVDDDTLIIRVRNFNVDYDYKVYDLSHKVVMGHFNHDAVVAQFVGSYRKYLLGGYFKQFIEGSMQKIHGLFVFAYELASATNGYAEYTYPIMKGGINMDDYEKIKASYCKMKVNEVMSDIESLNENLDYLKMTEEEFAMFYNSLLVAKGIGEHFVNDGLA